MNYINSHSGFLSTGSRCTIISLDEFARPILTDTSKYDLFQGSILKYS